MFSRISWISARTSALRDFWLCWTDSWDVCEYYRIWNLTQKWKLMEIRHFEIFSKIRLYTVVHLCTSETQFGLWFKLTKHAWVPHHAGVPPPPRREGEGGGLEQSPNPPIPPPTWIQMGSPRHSHPIQTYQVINSNIIWTDCQFNLLTNFTAN